MREKYNGTLNYKAGLKRLLISTGTANCAEPGQFLGITQAELEQAEQGGRIPPEWLVALLRVRSVNPDWILYGTRMRYLREAIAGPYDQYADGHTDREI